VEAHGALRINLNQNFNHRKERYGKMKVNIKFPKQRADYKRSIRRKSQSRVRRAQRRQKASR
jgi:hypothetical protein